MSTAAPSIQGIAAVLARPDCFPVGLSDDGRRLAWLDVGDCPFTHAVFPWSLQAWAAEHELGQPFEVELLELGNPNLKFEAVAPSLFIFHMSRCGSSLLARALAEHPRFIVMSELPALNHVLRQLCGGDLGRRIIGPAKRRVLANLIGLLGRRRRGSEEFFAVKFSSWNVLLIESLQAAFPQVPCVFMYRDPAEVLVSLLREPPGWVRGKASAGARSMAGATRGELDAMSDAEYVVRCLARMMRAGLSSASARYLDYADLDAVTLPGLLAELGIVSSDAEREAMVEPFGVHSKNADAGTPFVPDSADKQNAVDETMRTLVASHLGESHDALKTSERALRGTPHRGAAYD